MRSVPSSPRRAEQSQVGKVDVLDAERTEQRRWEQVVGAFDDQRTQHC